MYYIIVYAVIKFICKKKIVKLNETLQFKKIQLKHNGLLQPLFRWNPY